jgi:hypothetical protein
MVRLIVYLLVSFSLLLALARTATAGQAAVEYGLGAGRAATTAAPAKGIGKSMSGLADSLDKAVKAGQQASDVKPSPATPGQPVAKRTTSNAKTVSPSINTAPPPTPKWEDASGISTGLSYGELARRFGPPALEITNASGTSLIYSGKDGMFQIEMQGGTVTSIEKPKS